MPRYIPLTPEEQQQFGFGARKAPIRPRNTFFGDLTDAAQAGLAGATADTFEGVNQLTGLGVGPRDYFRGIQQRNLQGITPESQQAMEQTGFEGDTLDTLHPNPNASLRGTALHVAQGVGSFAPALVGGGALTKGLGVLGKAAPFVGFGGANALMTGGGAAEQARQEALNAPTRQVIENDPLAKDLMGKAYPAGVYDAPDVPLRDAPAKTRRFAVIDNATGKVEHVMDGDTLKAAFPSGKLPDRIRLAEIDAPEIAHHAGETGQPFGPESASMLRGMVGGQEVDVASQGKDPYGRTIGRVSADGQDVNAEMVKQGGAWVNRRFANDASLYDAEAKARADGKGLWREGKPTPPWLYRHPEGYDQRGEYQHVADLAKQEAAERAASEAFGPAALLGFVTGAAAGPIEAKLVTEGGGLLKKLATGVATEGSQEFVESGGQQMAVNQAMQPIDQRGLTKDALPQAVGGAVIGGLTGGAVGGAAGAFHTGYQSLLRKPTPEEVDAGAEKPEPQDVHDALRAAQEEASTTGKPVSLTKDPAAVEAAERNKQEIIAALRQQTAALKSGPADTESPDWVYNDEAGAREYAELMRAQRLRLASNQPAEKAPTANTDNIRFTDSPNPQPTPDNNTPDASGPSAPAGVTPTRTMQDELPNKIATLLARGFKNTDVATELGVDRRIVENVRKTYGIPPMWDPAFDEWSKQQLASNQPQPTTEETQNEAIPQPAVTTPGITELERSIQAAQPAVTGNRQLLEGAERPQPQPAVAETGRRVIYGQEARTDALESRQTADETRKEEGLLRPIPSVGVQAPTTEGIQVEEIQPEAIQVSENPLPPSAPTGNPLLRASAPETTAPLSPVAPRKGATLPVGNPQNEPETEISVRLPEFYEAKTKAQSLVSKWAKDLGLEAPALSDQHPSKLDVHGQYTEGGIRLGDKAARALVSKDPHEFVRAVETVAHEFGHHVAETHLVEAPETTQAEVEKDYRAWVASPEYKTFAEKMKSRRPAAAASAIQDTGRELTRAQQNYVVSKNEWLADNVARYLMKQEFNGPVSPETEGFIAQVAKAIKTLYTKLKADLNVYKAAPSLERFLDGMRIDRMIRENGVEDVTIEAPEEAPQGLKPASLERIRDYEVTRETSRQSPDLGRPASEEDDGEAGEVEQRIARPTVMWIHNNHNATVYSEDAPKGTQTFDAAGGRPNDAAAMRLVQYTHTGGTAASVKINPFAKNEYQVQGVDYKVTRIENPDRGAGGEPSHVWVAHRADEDANSAYHDPDDGDVTVSHKDYRVYELVEVSPGKVGLREKTIPTSVEGTADRLSASMITKRVARAKKSAAIIRKGIKAKTTPPERAREIGVFKVGDGEEVELDLIELTKVGADLAKDSEVVATDSVMVARNNFLRALGHLHSEFNIKPADGKIPRTTVIWKEGGREVTWGAVENIGSRIAKADKIYTELSRDRTPKDTWEFREMRAQTPEGAARIAERKKGIEPAAKLLRDFGLDTHKNERTGKEMLAGGEGETSEFALQGAHEGASRDEIEGAKQDPSTRAFRPAKPQTSRAKLSITSIVEGSKTIPKQLVTLVDDIALRILGINTAVEVADEHGIDSVSQKYGSDLDVVEKELAAETKARRKEDLQRKVGLLKDAIARIEEAKESGESHFIALDRFVDPSERRHLIFLPKGERGSEQRVAELMHELGHYIQRNAVDQLIREVKKAEEENVVTGDVAKKQQLLQGLFGVDSVKALKDMTPIEWFVAQESFANNLVKWAMSNEAPKNAVEKFFKSMGDKLRALWETFAAKFGKVAKDPQYKQFEAFMEGLIGARKGVEPKTALGKRYRDALQDIQVSSRPAKRGETLAQPYTGFDKLSAIARGEKIVKAREKTIGFLNDFARLWRTPIAELKSYGPRMAEVARKFRVMPGEKASGQTIHEQIQLHSAPFYAELHDLLSNLTGKKFLKSAEGKARYKQVADALIAQTSDAELKKQGLWEAELVRDYLEKLYQKLTGMGLEIGHRRDYFPLVIDRGKWNEDRHGVIDILKTQLQKEWRRKGQKVTDEEAETYAEALHQKIGMTDGVLFSMADKATENSQVWESVFGPNFRFRNERVMTDEMHKALKDYYVNDLGLILNMYTHSGFKRAVFQKEFGGRDFEGKFDPAWKLNRALIEATRGRSPEMTKTQMDRVVRVLFPALMGTLGQKEITPGWRAAQSWLQLGLNIGLLPLSLLSNIVELGQIDIRAGKYGMKDLLTGRNLVAMRKIFGLMKDRKEYGKLKNLATAIGTIRDDLTEHVLSSSMEAAYQIPITHKISEKYFRMIGMKWFSDFERIVAIGVAKDMFREYAADPAKYRKDLDELGITPQQIGSWFDATEDMKDNISAHGDVLNALNRWVDSALLRPNATIRPAYGSDPRFALVWHLKDFMWGFHEVILRRVWEQSKDQKHVMKALPWLMLGAAILPLAFVGSELRKKITKDVPSALLGIHIPEEPMSDGDYFLRLIDRAGILGPMQIFLDMEDASSHGKFALLSAMGPTLDKFQEFMLHDMDPIYTLSHTLPGFAQSRVLREAVFGR